MGWRRWRVAIVLIVVMAGCAVFHGRDNRPLATSVAHAARANKTTSSYPLERLKLLRYILQTLQKMYVDPTQFSPQKMFRAGLLRLEQKFVSFQVDFGKDGTTVKLGPHRKLFPPKRFLGLFDVWIQLRPIAQFINEHYDKSIALRKRDIEYYIVRGVMATLDKQTMIVDPRLYRRGRRRRRLIKNGKIGVYLQLKKGRLTITKVIQDGPADQAGLKDGDQIVKIDGKAVKSESLRKLSAKVRGLRGTRLTVHIKRKGWKAPKRFVLIRAAMKTPNVTGHILPGKIGYVRLRQFIHGSALAIREQLARIRHQAKGSLFGLILDLRNNGGGLVNEAVAICSMFVDKGEVTTFAGANIKRRTHNVKGTNTEERYPMITLVNGYSASASELLSGALQNHNRSLIVGRQSYGKGTVQRAGPMGALGLYFRVTIAQYMLPGNQSIQAVGVTPDIELLPVDLTPNQARYYSVKPRDLAQRRKRWPKFLLQNMDPKIADKSWAQVYHLRQSNSTKAKKKKKYGRKDWYMDPKHPLGTDFDVWFARYLLAHAKSSRRDIFYSQVKRPLERAKRKEESKLVKALRAQKLDWRLPRKRPKSKAKLIATATLLGAKGTIVAGKPFKLQLQVKNVGKGVAYRTRAVLYANSKTLRYREFLLGRIRPGQQRTQTIKVTLPIQEQSRVDILRFDVQAEGASPSELRMNLPWTTNPRPRFAIATHIQDPAPDGNGDGMLQAGERATLFVTVKNVSRARSLELRTILSPGGLRTNHKVHKLGQLPAGQQRTMTFALHVPDNAKEGKLSARLFLYDKQLRHIVQHKLPLRVTKALSSLTKPAKGWVALSGPTNLRTAPRPNAAILGHAPKGTILRVLRTWRSYVKVALPSSLFPPNPAKIPPPQKTKKNKKKQTANKKRKAPKALPNVQENKRVKAPPLRKKVALSAWIYKKSTTPATTKNAQHQGISAHFHFQPPKIEISLPSTPYVTAKSAIKLPVSILSQQGIKDVYVFRGKRKLYYEAIQFKEPKGQKLIKRRIPITLKPGVNRVRLIVRTASSRYHRQLYITHRASNNASTTPQK